MFCPEAAVENADQAVRLRSLSDPAADGNRRKHARPTKETDPSSGV
jgi:hypothetical protein